MDSQGRRLACGHPNGDLTLWDVEASKVLSRFAVHRAAVACVKFDSAERLVLTGGDDWTVGVWEFPSGQSKANLRGHSSRVTAIALSPSGRYAVSAGGWDQTILIWDLTSFKCVASHRSAWFDVTHLSLSPDERWLLSAGGDGWIELWDFAMALAADNQQPPAEPVV